MSGDVAYCDAIWHARRDAVGVIALYRRGADPDEYNEIFRGMAEKMSARNEE